MKTTLVTSGSRRRQIYYTTTTGSNPSSQDSNGWGQWTRADGDSIGTDLTVMNVTKFAGQYPPEVAAIFKNIEIAPDDLALILSPRSLHPPSTFG
ncbi:glycoside hydrolase family 67 protein [Zopfia rhizophila CBS 207.26]|uniref:Glycoside hydrolase family 67 protein n=1 Tax=Zopfia rhizophila CBS 207.26 TaxID=1314779 RepID=A0A6A6EJM8_9PEZI|nr:glycoside hydrolase family 67 protein [Zopfia rhizophila CBS 207.26]